MPAKRNVLVIPSWYPRPDDRINGSFFQEQARLLTDRFDVKVLLIRFHPRPSIEDLRKNPFGEFFSWLRLSFRKRTRTSLTVDDLFLNPPLLDFSMGLLALTQRGRFEKSLDAYLAALDELIATGWKPDLIHAHSVDFAGLAARRIKEVRGIPYVLTEHMPFALNNYPPCLRDDIKRAFVEANVVLSLGYDKVRQLGISGIDVEPHLIYNLVDERAFSEMCAPYQAGAPLKLISIGAASHLKDHRTLVRALALLKERQVPFRLTLIGLKVWGGLYDETLDFIHRNGLADDVQVIDSIDRKQVPGCLAANQIYLITSIAEGLPVTVLEAMACGLFIVATRHGGTEDVLTPESGVLVEVKNHQKIADRLEAIYRGEIHFDPQTIRDHVVSLCGTEAFASRLTGFYQQALGESL